MSTWARTLEGDLYLPPRGEGADAIVTDPVQAMKIKIPSVLQFVRGEWALNTSEGFPWVPIFTQRNPSLPGIQLQIRKAILAIPGVARVIDTAIALDRLTRNLTEAVQVKVGLTGGQQVTSP